MDMLAGFIGVVISVATKLIPGIAKWYYTIDSKWRGLVMLGFVMVASGILYGVSCLGLFNAVSCSAEGMKLLFQTIGMMLITNQLTNLMTPDSAYKTAQG